MKEEEIGQVTENESLMMLERAHVRHMRRIRNQIIAYSVVVLLLGAAVFGTYIGSVRLIGVIAERRVAAEMAAEAEAAEMAEETETEDAEETILLSEPETLETPETVEEEIPQASDEELLEDLISEVIEGMPLKDKVAGMFIATPEQFTDVDVAIKAGDGTEEALQNTAIGGLVYSGKNIKTEDQIREMLSKTKDMSKYPIFLATMESGGENSGLTEALSLEPVYPPAILAENGETEAAYEVGAELAKRMVDVGFTVNLAPCANLTTEAMSDEERELSFGSDPAVASALLAAQIRGLEENGVHSTVRMFPASAVRSGDSNIPMTKESVQSLQENEFKMFASAIEAGTKIIMVGNLAAPEIVGDNTPCTMSSIIITDQLRGALGFTGVVVTDAMDDPVITDYYTSDQAAIAAIKAGADMIYRPENLEEALNGVVDAVNSGSLTEDRINESLMRIFRVKYAGRIETSISAN